VFEYLKGEISEITPAFLVLEVTGIGFQIALPNPYVFANKIGEVAKIYVQQVVREDSQSLYGFQTGLEKNLFLKLISVSGIGPKSALAILAKEDFSGIVNAINSEDVKYLMKFPGVGKKTAQQIVLDLQGKLTEIVEISKNSAAFVPPNGENCLPILQEALEALCALGYADKDIRRIKNKLEVEPEVSTDAYLRKALKLL